MESWVLVAVLAIVVAFALAMRRKTFNATQAKARDKREYIRKWRPEIEKLAAMYKTANQQIPVTSDFRRAQRDQLTQMQQRALGWDAPDHLQGLHSAYLRTIQSMHCEWDNPTQESAEEVYESWKDVDHHLQLVKGPKVVPQTNIGAFLFGTRHQRE